MTTTPSTDQDQDPHTPKSNDATSDSTGGGHPFKVTVRTLAGHSRKETVKPSDTVADITDGSVKFFVHKGELTEGSYALTLPRSGGDAELDPTASLQDAGVVEGDVLVLVNRQPQTDG